MHGGSPSKPSATGRFGRQRYWDAIEAVDFDVAVVGGGITGASVYHQLSRDGYRVLLVEQGDFAGGTSQSSAMWIWGGLLYLRNLELRSVARFCSARDRMVRELTESVEACPIRYMPTREDKRSPRAIAAALYLYWALGAFRRSRPVVEAETPARDLFESGRLGRSLLYEEARVFPSDARFVLGWILPYLEPSQPALNYCRLAAGRYDISCRTWRLDLADELHGGKQIARARLVVNAAGVWTDRINEQFGIRTAYKHVLSKGVSIGLPRDPRLSSSLVFETRENGDCMSLTPWGPIALWGPTETLVADIETGFQAEEADVRLLLEELNRHLIQPATPADVVSVRCGVRPLAVAHSFIPGADTLGLSRDFVAERDRDVPWISIFGGKITGCQLAARDVARLVRTVISPVAPQRRCDGPRAEPEWDMYPGIAGPMPSAQYCREWELCCTLEDYLRRRTNIAQWVTRGGLGRNGENLPRLLEIARVFSDGDELVAREAVHAYQRRVQREFDQVISACTTSRVACTSADRLRPFAVDRHG